ncbi:MAG: TIGR02301 family protein [Pseudolabrys sp.]
MPLYADNQPAPPPPNRSAPFDHNLERLAEILGALHYLRPMCGAHDGGRWRSEMKALLAAEAPSGERRRKFVASFNRGYRGFQQTYRTCTPAASIAIRRYLQEGARIAHDIGARYPN